MSKSFRDELAAALPSLQRYAEALTRARYDADDLVQDTIERALINQHLHVETRSIRPWLHTIAYHLFIDRIRRRKRQTRIEGIAIDDMEAFGAGAAPPRQIDHRFLREVQQLINRLPPENRKILLTVGLEGHSHAYAAASFNVPPGTVRSRLWRSRSALSNVVQ